MSSQNQNHELSSQPPARLVNIDGDAYHQGIAAYYDGDSDNPYSKETQKNEYWEWNCGWLDAREWCNSLLNRN